MTDQPHHDRRWSDDRLTDRFDSISSEFVLLRPLPMEVARAHMRIDALADDIREIKDAIGAFRGEYQADRANDRQESSTRGRHRAVIYATIVVAAATVLGSLAVALASLLGGAP